MKTKADDNSLESLAKTQKEIKLLIQDYESYQRHISGMLSENPWHSYRSMIENALEKCEENIKRLKSRVI